MPATGSVGGSVLIGAQTGPIVDHTADVIPYESAEERMSMSLLQLRIKPHRGSRDPLWGRPSAYSRRLHRFAWASVALSLLAALGGTAAAAEPPDPPSQWLATEGKSQDWVKTTARCRELLARLRVDDPLVRRHLARVRERAWLVRRLDRFDWKTITAVEFLENLLTDLIAGAEPNRRYAGTELALPYWSERMGRVEAIWIHVPPGYDPGRTYQLFLYYKCGGGIHFENGRAAGGYRPTVEMANQTDTFHAWSSLYYGVKGRMGVDYEMMEAVPAMAQEFSIDLDRVFLSGYSDGGFTSLWLASRYPHLVAGIAPECANWQYSNVNQIGLFNVPILVVDGWSDGGYLERSFTRWHTLRTVGCDVACLIGHHGHTYAPYEDASEFKQILDWAKPRRRNPWPKRVRYATWNLSWHRAFWVSIERMANPSLAAQIDAEAKDGNRIEVQAWNVAAYKLTLTDKLVDPTKPVTVITNGTQSHSGPFQVELAIDVLKLPTGKFVKRAGMDGDITTQIERSCYGSKEYLRIADRRWLWVKPTGGTEGTRALLGKWWPEWAKADTDLSDSEIAGHNLFLLGGPDVNKLTARFAADLPVKFGEGHFSIGKRVYGQPTNCVKFIHPNPLNPAKYVIVYAFNDAAAFAENRFFGTKEESAWGFRSGDAVVMGIAGRHRKWGVTVDGPEFGSDHILFDSNWQPPDETPIGELEKPFDYADILRLRADAIREGTGADIGIIPDYTPGWRRWGTFLPAGPVTLHDIATTDMFPEYVTLCDASGQSLAEMLKHAAASSAQPEIDPARTYRLAMGYEGIPAFRVEPPRLPNVISFRTPEEFLAFGHTSLPVRNLNQIPLEVTEAVASYIKKRGKVAPRVECFDLAAYIQNPETHSFAACDWLHLGADVAWKRPPAGKPMGYRYTLALGLRAAPLPSGEGRVRDARSRRTPRSTPSKAFLDLDAKEPTRFDFATLDRKLPVSVAAQPKPFDVANGKALFFDVRLTNSGPRDVSASVVLAPSAMQHVEGFTWPNPQDKAAPAPWYSGFRVAIGEYRKPTLHEDAALLLFDGPAPKMQKLVARGAGYNFGLIGIHHAITIRAGTAASVPLLFLAVDRPENGPAISLPDLLDSAKGNIAR